MALGNKKDREDEDDDRDSCNRRLQNKSFGATALWMRFSEVEYYHDGFLVGVAHGSYWPITIMAMVWW